MPSNTLVNIPEEMEEQKTNLKIECRVKTNDIQHDAQSIHLLKCAELYRLFFLRVLSSIVLFLLLLKVHLNVFIYECISCLYVS